MSIMKWSLAIGCLLAVGCQSKYGLPDATTPEVMTLYSIDGNYFDPGGAFIPPTTPDREIMYRWPVLGKVEIVDATERQELWDALRTGIEEYKSEIPAPACFNPRHALRVMQSGVQTDYVVCFECSQIKVYPGEPNEEVLTTSYADAAFNRVLKAANVPLAPGGKE